MINIAIVEDEMQDAQSLYSLLDTFSGQTGEEFNIKCFTQALQFLTNYSGNYDLVFMDIMLPDMNGMEAAKRLRGIDKRINIVFITNMPQYAVDGYDVAAVGFIVKPIIYSSFRIKMLRILELIRRNEKVVFTVKGDDVFIPLRASDIRYVEVSAHKVIFHTLSGDYNTYGTLKKVEKSLLPYSFVRCNSCYLVNLRYVTSVNGYTVCLGKDKLLISHPRKQSFLHELNDFFGDM